MSAIKAQVFASKRIVPVEESLRAFNYTRLSVTPDGRIWQVTLPLASDADRVVDDVRRALKAEIIAWHVNKWELQITFGFIEEV